jgi:pimeloyl-ACP methyl ester carboxylesterase
MNIFLKILLRVIIYSFFIIGGLSLYTFFTSIKPPRHITSVTPADLGLNYEDITIVTEDNVRLAGWFIPSENAGNKAVIVCHGYPADKGDVLTLATFLHDKFNLLLFDFRAMGKSGGKITTAGWREKKDFLAAVEYIKSRGMEEIGAFGFSMGGAVIIMANSPDVDCIVSESAYRNLESMLHVMYQNFGIIRHPFVYATRLWSRLFIGVDLIKVSPEDAVKNIKCPIFLVHSERDSMIPIEHAHALKRANPEAKLWIIDEADHGAVWGLMRREYEGRILEFLLSAMERL